MRSYAKFEVEGGGRGVAGRCIVFGMINLDVNAYDGLNGLIPAALKPAR